LLLRRPESYLQHTSIATTSLFPQVGGADCGSASRIGTCPDSPRAGACCEESGNLRDILAHPNVGVGTARVSRFIHHSGSVQVAGWGAIALTPQMKQRTAVYPEQSTTAIIAHHPAAKYLRPIPSDVEFLYTTKALV